MHDDENLEKMLSQTKDLLLNCLVYRLGGQAVFTVQELLNLKQTIYSTRITVNDKDETILTTVLVQGDYPNGR